MNPLVSVIMPAYNSEKYIGKAIESVIIQDVSLELIIVNDCSSDNTISVVNEYIRNNADNIIKLYSNEQNLGAALSRNKGVSIASGKYIAFLDADDIWATDKLKKQIALLERNNMVLCSTARRLLTPEGNFTDKIISVPEHITYKMLLGQNVINCSSVLVLRDAIIKYPMGHEDSHEDYITWLKLLSEYKEACAINEPLLLYRLSATGKSGSKLNSAKMTFKVYRYMGFGIFKSIFYFISYAMHGVIKYYLK